MWLPRAGEKCLRKHQIGDAALLFAITMDYNGSLSLPTFAKLFVFNNFLRLPTKLDNSTKTGQFCFFFARVISRGIIFSIL